MSRRLGGTWLYIFTDNQRFPDPLEEIAFLGGQAERGKRCFLMLADRKSPPMARAETGDCVILCTRGDGVLRKHGYGTVKVGPFPYDTTPEDVLPIYGRVSGRTFVELGEVRLHDAQPVTEVDTEAVGKLALGQAYVKRLSPEPPMPCEERATTPAGRTNPGNIVAEKRRLRSINRDVVVVGLDPTAGDWDSRMTAGRKRMPSVCLVLRGSGHIELADGGVAWHATNEDFWQRIGAVGATTVAIDGPCRTNGLRVRAEWNGWDLSVIGGSRDSERELATAGVGLFWTTYPTISRFDGASRWIARALRLFADANERHGLNVIETHPHGAFHFLNRSLGGQRLAPKTSPDGRAARLAILAAFIDGLSEQTLKNHDAVDAACAALLAALYVTGQVRPFGTDQGGGVIWMPEVDLEGSEVFNQIVAVGREGLPAIPPLLMNERMAWRVVAGDSEGWQRAGARLSDDDLRDLIRGLLLYARASGRMIGGSASPVIVLYREVVARSPSWEPELTKWIVGHRTNPYEPFGTGDDFGATSWAEYSERLAESSARRGANVEAESERQAADSERRRARDAAEATSRLAAAVRRGDLGAVTSLLGKGGDPAAALPGGASLVEWAEQHGRNEVASYLRERGIP